MTQEQEFSVVISRKLLDDAARFALLEHFTGNLFPEGNGSQRLVLHVLRQARQRGWEPAKPTKETS